jgi:hypothetical protein
MKRLTNDPGLLEALLKPENELELALLQSSDFRFGLLWGEPRFGHPEGQVCLHVREVLDNIERLPSALQGLKTQLRLIALVHDTFKYKEDRSRPRDWTKHHGILARRFLESYTHDRAVLDVIETHDDAYYAWLNSNSGHSGSLSHKTLDSLQLRVGYCWQLYYTFFKCDTQTGDKTQASVKWFEREAKGLMLFSLNE